MKKVGIFSGTFDPVHNGHLEFAKQAIEQVRLDKVFFMVEPNPRRKQGVKSLIHRQKMVELAAENEAKFGIIILEQNRFTADKTLPILEARFKGAEIFMLMGDDMLLHLAEWPNVDRLLKRLGFIIGIRYDTKQAESRLEALQKTRGLKFNYHIFSSQLPEVSSSKIRTEVRSGQATGGLPEPVLEYIKTEGLYSAISLS